MKGKYIQFVAGILIGATLAPTAHAAVQQFTATHSTQKFYVDGKQVQLEAYSINGSNYVKLRDIGKAVGFGVSYDGSTNSVYIDPNSPYQEEVKQATASPSTAITEENVRSAIWALLDTYPTNTYYGAFYLSNSNGPYGRAPSNCAGWATLCSDAAFGDLPWRRIENPRWEDIRPGDLVRYDNANGGHVVAVLDRTDEYILTTESGTNNKARWGGQYFKFWLEEQSGYTAYTRYPQ